MIGTSDGGSLFCTTQMPAFAQYFGQLRITIDITIITTVIALILPITRLCNYNLQYLQYFIQFKIVTDIHHHHLHQTLQL